MCESAPGYYELDFTYFDWTIHIRVCDEFNISPEPETWLKICDADEADVTRKYMHMPDGPGFIRPTMYNIREVIRILDENMDIEVENWPAQDGD
jgi:hypothetical protein